MAINVNVQYNGGLLPDVTKKNLHGIYYIVDPMLFPSGNPFKYHEDFFLYLQPLIPPKRFDNFPPLTGGCSEEGLGGAF